MMSASPTERGDAGEGRARSRTLTRAGVGWTITIVDQRCPGMALDPAACVVVQIPIDGMNDIPHFVHDNGAESWTLACQGIGWVGAANWHQHGIGGGLPWAACFSAR